MRDWNDTILGDVIITNDATYSAKENWESINYLDTGNITENQIAEIQHLIVGEDKIPSRAKRKINSGDIVYSTVRPNQKHYGIIKKPIENLLVSTGFVTIRAKEDLAITDFVYWYLVQPEVIELLQTIGEHSTSAYPSIKPSDIEGLKLRLPPLPEQKAIAHILGSLDDKIELNLRMNETLEAIAQSLFKSWFVDFDPVIDNALASGNDIPEELTEKAEIRVALGDERRMLPEEVQKLFPDEFEYTEEIGWIPKGWTTKSVDTVLDINPSVKLSKGQLAPYVDMKALPTTGYSVLDVGQKAYSGGAKFQNGDILLARITPCLENGKTAVVDFLDGQEVGFGSTEFIILRGIGAIKTPYVACLSRDKKFREHSIQSMVGSSGRQRVQNSCYSNFFLALPKTEDLLTLFNSLTEDHFNKATAHTNQIRYLINVRDTLLPKLLSGEIRVSDIKVVIKDIL